MVEGSNPSRLARVPTLSHDDRSAICDNPAVSDRERRSLPLPDPRCQPGLPTAPLYAPTSKVLFAKTGDVLTGITTTSKLPDDQQVELLKKLAALAAVRL